MNKHSLVIILVVLVAIVICTVWAFSTYKSNPSLTATTTPSTTVTPATTTTPVQSPIIVLSPSAHATIASPITITGSARGSWYFEASFPIEIRNAANVVIGQGHAEAQADWMTNNFVPFKAVITFTAQPAGSTGTIVLKNDNPSGDPARDMQITVPVTF